MLRAEVTLLLAIAVVFTGGCDRMPGGKERMKPIAEIEVKPENDPTVRDFDKPDPAGERAREATVARLEKLGFSPAKGLPTAGHRRFVDGKLRPSEEIARRLMALNALFTYVVAPEGEVSTVALRSYAKSNALEAAMSGEEREIFLMDRAAASAAHAGTIGWRLENMWALAWVLGYAREPALAGGEIPEAVIGEILSQFLLGLERDVATLTASTKVRSQSEVVALEDAFYCAHNAARAAQLGNTEATPKGFRPIVDGGAIHERRHSLTWVLSPGVTWDDTDLST